MWSFHGWDKKKKEITLGGLHHSRGNSPGKLYGQTVISQFECHSFFKVSAIDKGSSHI
jgi:hypothetical protein